MGTGDHIHGEGQIIAEFMAPLAAGYPGALGLQDDCALLTPRPGTEIVLKTDPVVAGVHFLADADPADIAWRALAVNVSDLAAKGARPLAYLMALALPGQPERTWLARFAAGLGEAQAAFGCHLIGGDTDRSTGPLGIAITVLGEVPAGRMVRRATARAGDALFVTGTLGDAALGLKLLRQPQFAPAHGLDADATAYLAGRFLRPSPRLAIGPLLMDLASAAMDLSDGLVKDLGRMCSASGVSATIRAGDLPLSAAARRCGAEAVEDALSAGDDYEVLAAVPASQVSAFVARASLLPFGVTRVGEIAAGSGVAVIGADGKPMQLARTGWDHF